ncbi:MAG: ABC transporter permease subunit [Acholeplasmatales bacterium]
MSKNTNIYTTIGIILIFIFWLVSSIIVNDNFIIPSLDKTFTRTIDLLKNANTYISIFNTIIILIIILIVSFLVSGSLALLSVKFPKFKETVTPILSLLKIIPLPALIILLLTHQSRGNTSIILTSFMTIPLMYDILYGHLISINKEILDEIKMLSKFNFKTLFNIYIPLLGVGIITAFLQAFGLGLKVKVMTEFVTNAPKTIGYDLSMAAASYAMDLVFAWTLVLVIIVVIADFIINMILKKLEMK